MWKFASLPKSTVIQCGIAAVISVLLMSWLRIRPLGIFFLATFGLWFYKTRCNLRIVPPPELQKKIEKMSEKIQDIRQNKPTMFCLISAGCLSALAIVGHLLSGSTMVLTGLVLAAILSTKYSFKIIKIEHKDFAWADKINHDPEYDDEFLPDVDEKNRSVLDRAGDLASISSPTEEVINGDDEEEKSDDIPSELLIPDPIPEIDESSSDDDHDLVPIVKSGDEIIEAIRATSSSSKINSQNPKSGVMEFKKGHFKSDSSLSSSSSSSEESLSKGLQFPDHNTVVDAPALQRLSSPSNQEASDLVTLAVKTQLANSSKLLPSLVSGLVQWGMNTAAASNQAAVIVPTDNSKTQHRMVTALDSSDESDFEILETDDFK